jgi:hypothetical protein
MGRATRGVVVLKPDHEAPASEDDIGKHALAIREAEQISKYAVVQVVEIVDQLTSVARKANGRIAVKAEKTADRGRGQAHAASRRRLPCWWLSRRYDKSVVGVAGGSNGGRMMQRFDSRKDALDFGISSGTAFSIAIEMNILFPHVDNIHVGEGPICFDAIVNGVTISCLLTERALGAAAGVDHVVSRREAFAFGQPAIKAAVARRAKDSSARLISLHRPNSVFER